MAFDIFRTLDLGFLGKEWEGCYLKFSYLTANEAKDFSGLKIDKENPDPENVNALVDKALSVLESKFIEGKAVKGGKISDVTKEDIKELPVELLNKCVEVLVSALPEGEKKEAGSSDIPSPSGE